MATERQIQANRNNATKSTGPCTEEGKARVSQNALKHGLLARDAVIPGEDPAEFEAQLAALEDAIQPEDALEREFVRQIADAQWRMRRLTRLETGYLAACLVKSRRHAKEFQHEYLRPGYEGETLMLGYSISGETQELLQLARYDAHLGRRLERALQQIARLREAREKRRRAELKDSAETLNYPAGPENGAAPRPPNPPPPPPPVTPDPRNAASKENGETNPIPSNSRVISQLSGGRFPSAALIPPPTPRRGLQTARSSARCEIRPAPARRKSRRA